MGVVLSDREENAPEFQSILTQNREAILSRNGIPHPSGDGGLILVIMECTPEKQKELMESVQDLPSEAQCMRFG